MRKLAVFGFLLGALVSQGAQADPRERWERRQDKGGLLGGALEPVPLAPPQDHSISPAEAARIAQDKNGGGRVLSVDRRGEDFRVRLLKDGEVRTVYVTKDGR